MGEACLLYAFDDDLHLYLLYIQLFFVVFFLLWLLYYGVIALLYFPPSSVMSYLSHLLFLFLDISCATLYRRRSNACSCLKYE
jgi:hypothetical protein